MNKLWQCCIASPCYVATLAVAIGFTGPPAAALDTWTDVTPGVVHLHRTLTSPRPLNIHVLFVDAGNPNVRVGAIMKNEYSGPDSGETVSSMARRHSALAAINCDYFSSGTVQDHQPQGICVQDGAYIPGSGYVPNRLSWVFNGQTLESTMDVYGTTYPYTPPSWITNAASGGPRLVRNGAISIENTSGLPSAYSLNPRTALGITQDRRTLILAVVDGRQSGFSEGMTGVELGQMLIDLGAWDAMNFDSGGSSTFYLNGSVRNRPSDGVERKVANGIAVWDTSDPGPQPLPALAASFENPPFQPGPVAGQQGFGGAAAIVPGNGVSGSAGLLLDNNHAERSFTTSSVKTQWIDFRAKRSDYYGTSTVSFGASPSEVFGIIRFHTDGKLGCFVGFGGGSGFWQSMVSYTVNTWYRLSIRVDYSANVLRYSVYIDGRQYAVGIPRRDDASSSGLGWIRFDDSTSGGMAVDDLRIGSPRFDFPWIDPDDLAIPEGGLARFRLKSASASSGWTVLDEQLPDSSQAAPGSVAKVDSGGLVTAVQAGSFLLRAADQNGRKATSRRIAVTDADSLASARVLEDGSQASVGGAVVTAAFPGFAYVEQPDRAAGLRVQTSLAPAAGDRMSAAGMIQTIDGEKALLAASAWSVPGQPLFPLAMTARTAGIRGQAGLSPAGLLARVAGRVSSLGSGVFFINDGSLPGDGLPVLWSGAGTPDVGDFVLVTGPVGAWNGSGEYIGALRPVSPEDIVPAD